MKKAPYASVIVNIRVKSVMLNDMRAMPQCAVIAYGTVITYAS